MSKTNHFDLKAKWKPFQIENAKMIVSKQQESGKFPPNSSVLTTATVQLAARNSMGLCSYVVTNWF